MKRISQLNSKKVFIVITLILLFPINSNLRNQTGEGLFDSSAILLTIFLAPIIAFLLMFVVSFLLEEIVLPIWQWLNDRKPE